MPAAANPFWHFSLRTWRIPGVQAACLALQEHRGADVNLLLFCGWTGREGRELDRRDLRQAIGCVGNWQSEVIAPLRLARRGLKHQRAGTPAAALAPAFRNRFLALELALERAEQALLADLATQWAAPVRSCRVAAPGHRRQPRLLSGTADEAGGAGRAGAPRADRGGVQCGATTRRLIRRMPRGGPA